MRVRILPYKQYSASAKALSRALGIKRLSLVRTKFNARLDDIIVNWGNTSWSARSVWLNHPYRVVNARDKLMTLSILADNSVPTVEWTPFESIALEWLETGHTVFTRRSTTGQGGSGILICEGTRAILPEAPLYTKLFKAKHEYRVHVVGDSVHISKKRRRDGVPRALVRNHANGYVYCTENVSAPEPVVRVAIDAIRALGLHFGAVDVLCTDKGDARVLEVNTAPGLEGRTLEFYAGALAREVISAKASIRRTRQDQVAV